MTGEEWALAVSIFFSGLAAGLLGMLCTIMRPMLQAMDGRDFRNFMEAFLRFAEHSLGKVYNFAWSLVMAIGPIVALVFLWDDPGSTSFILTAIGLGIVLVGIWHRLQRVEDPDLQRDLGLGSRRDAGGLGGGTAAATSRSTGSNCATTWAAFALFLGP